MEVSQMTFFKRIFVNENVWISIKISLKTPTNNIPTMVQIMVWRPPGDKPLSELVMVMLPAHICVTRHQRQWVKRFRNVLKPAEFPWWRHQMETFSALLAICAGNSPVPGEFPTQRPVTRALMFSLICVWINDWVNNREAGDLRRYRAHYDVSVMSEWLSNLMPLNV